MHKPRNFPGARAIYTRTTDLGELKAVAGDCYVLMVKWNKNGTISNLDITPYSSINN